MRLSTENALNHFPARIRRGRKPKRKTIIPKQRMRAKEKHHQLGNPANWNSVRSPNCMLLQSPHSEWSMGVFRSMKSSACSCICICICIPPDAQIGAHQRQLVCVFVNCSFGSRPPHTSHLTPPDPDYSGTNCACSRCRKKAGSQAICNFA